MEDLVQQLKERADLTDEQAVKVIATMKDYLMGKVPPMFSGFVDNFFAGNSAQSSDDSFMP